MITCNRINKKNINSVGDSGFGNTLFWIAGTIGVATKLGYEWAFPEWINNEYFINKLPTTDLELPEFYLPQNHIGYHFGFTGFDVPDNHNLIGEFGSEKYFVHCEELIRHYFQLKPLTDVIEDAIIIHYRDYVGGGHYNWYDLDKNYYNKALDYFPDMKKIVITDNIESAKKAIGIDCEYRSRTTIEDFYQLATSKYLIMANSTFSWWGAYLSKAKVVAPYNWFRDDWTNKTYIHTDLYCKDWIII